MKVDALAPEIAALLREPVLFIEDVARVYRVSRDTVERRLKRRTWPVAPAGAIASRRWWRASDIANHLGLEVTSP